MPVMKLADARRAERGDFIQTIFGVDNPGALAAQLAKDLRESIGWRACADR